MTDLATLAAALASGRFTHRALGDGTGVIVDIDGMDVFTLNETGEFLVAAIAAGATGEPALVNRLVAEFEVETPQAEADVAAFVDELGAHLRPAEWRST